ncbi:unnamed protein product [Camellia sinensis]
MVSERRRCEQQTMVASERRRQVISLLNPLPLTRKHLITTRNVEVARHRTEARSVKLSSCFLKSTIVPHFEVPSSFKPRLLGVFQIHPFVSVV